MVYNRLAYHTNSAGKSLFAVLLFLALSVSPGFTGKSNTKPYYRPYTEQIVYRRTSAGKPGDFKISCSSLSKKILKDGMYCLKIEWVLWIQNQQEKATYHQFSRQDKPNARPYLAFVYIIFPSSNDHDRSDRFIG